MKRIYTLITIFFLFIFQALAQNISISVSAPKVVEEGTPFYVRYSINADPENQFSLETCNEIQTYGHPQTGSSSSISIVNGKMTQSHTYTETHQFRATKKGTFPLPIASVKIDGKTYKSKAQNIEVVDNASGSNSTAQSQQNQRQSQITDPKPENASEDIFARIFVNKNSAYIGEPILATIKLYTQKDIANINDYTLPDFNGFFKRVLEQPQKLEYTEENINGKQYYSVLFQRVVIYPQKEGKLTISPFKINCNIIAGYTSGGFWGFSQRKIEERNINSKPVSITVKPFPIGKTTNFTGAVGKFSMSASTDVTSIPANEAFSLKVTIKGEGNFSLLTKPNITFPQDFEVYDPKTTDNFSISATGDKGSKTFEYVIIPRHEGKFTIPSITMQTLNPATKTYNTLTTDEIQITVTKGSANGNVVSNYTQTTKEDVQFGNDIQFIKTGKLHLQKESFFYRTLWFWLINIGLVIITTIIIVIRRKQIELNSDITRMKHKRANKESQKRLKNARKFLDSGNDTQYYEEVAKALWGYIGDKFSIEQIDLTTDKIKDHLSTKGIENELIEELLQVIQQCEFARFAPSSSIEGKEKLFSQAEDIIQKFEQKKK